MGLCGFCSARFGWWCCRISMDSPQQVDCCTEEKDSRTLAIHVQAPRVVDSVTSRFGGSLVPSSMVHILLRCFNYIGRRQEHLSSNELSTGPVQSPCHAVLEPRRIGGAQFALLGTRRSFPSYHLLDSWSRILCFAPPSIWYIDQYGNLHPTAFQRRLLWPGTCCFRWIVPRVCCFLHYRIFRCDAGRSRTSPHFYLCHRHDNDVIDLFCNTIHDLLNLFAGDGESVFWRGRDIRCYTGTEGHTLFRG
mmetsp:Transcript_17492/g.42554  ORF Transcript_17492/g.42554 Transcript_17492/m.42554 type:complete len:248 (-) Transcript_17492:2638-3381(-)